MDAPAAVQVAALQEQIQQLQLQLQQQQDQQHPPQEQGDGQPQIMNANAPPINNAAVCRVAVRLPPFWADKPCVWFAQVEAQFALSHITQDGTKYDYVVAQLESRYANEVADILNNPPAVDRYQRLKTELIRRLSLSEEQKVRQLLMLEELGDRKPSQFLRHMHDLAGNAQVQDSFLRTLWLQRLPTNIQAILQAHSGLPLDQVAEIADRIMEVSPPTFTTNVHSINNKGDNSMTLSDRLDDITRQLRLLQSQMRNFGDNRSRSSSRGQSRSCSRTRDSVGGSQPDKSHCWYHHRYGNKARKCIPPCSFDSVNASGSS